MSKPPIGVTLDEIRQLDEAICAALIERDLGEHPDDILGQPYAFYGRGRFHATDNALLRLGGRIEFIHFLPEYGLVLVPSICTLVTPGHNPSHYNIRGFWWHEETRLWQIVRDDIRPKSAVQGVLRITRKPPPRKR